MYGFYYLIQVDDQMKLLQHAWSDMLVLDHIHQRIHAGLPDETTLPNGQKFDLLSLALLGVPQVADQLHRVTARLQELKVDTNDYICLKFLLLLNPGEFNIIFLFIFQSNCFISFHFFSFIQYKLSDHQSIVYQNHHDQIVIF